MTSTNANNVYLKPWAIFFVISFVAGTVAGAIVGGVSGGILAALGAQRLISLVSGGLGFLVSLPISYFCFRFVVAKFFVPKTDSVASTVEPLKAAA